MGKYLELTPLQNWIEIDENDYESSFQLLRDNLEGNIALANYDQKLNERGIDIWVNDDGKLLNMAPTVLIASKDGPVDILVGNVIFARSSQQGETLPLNNDDISFIKDHFRINQTIFVLQQDFLLMKTINI